MRKDCTLTDGALEDNFFFLYLSKLDVTVHTGLYNDQNLHHPLKNMENMKFSPEIYLVLFTSLLILQTS